MVKRGVGSRKHQPAYVRIPARRYGLVFFYLGVVLLVIAFFINFIYIRPTNFKAQFRSRQLAACLKAGNSSSYCHKHFGE